MASARATVTLSPLELQVVSAALGVFAHVCERRRAEGTDNVLKGYRLAVTLSDGNLDTLARMARKIQREIGLK